MGTNVWHFITKSDDHAVLPWLFIINTRTFGTTSPSTFIKSKKKRLEDKVRTRSQDWRILALRSELGNAIGWTFKRSPISSLIKLADEVDNVYFQRYAEKRRKEIHFFTVFEGGKWNIADRARQLKLITGHRCTIIPFLNGPHWTFGGRRSGELTKSVSEKAVDDNSNPAFCQAIPFSLCWTKFSFDKINPKSL